jgi:O-antigen/teichoic acid export membrane protein
LAFDWEAARPFVRFGAGSAGRRVINYATMNLDFALIGGALGARALGPYALAYNLATLAVTKVNAIFTRVFFPTLSRLQDDPPRLLSAFIRYQRVATLINFPIVVALGLTAQYLPTLLGRDWNRSVLLLQVLCVAGLARAAGSTVGPLLLAKGRVRLGIRWGLLALGIQAPLLVIGIAVHGVVGVAIAYAIGQTFLMSLSVPTLLQKLVDISLREYLAALRPASAFSALMAMTMVGVGAITTGDPKIEAVVQLASGAVVYAGLNLMFNRADITALLARGNERANPVK